MGVGPVQQGHTGQILLAHLQSQGQQVVHAPVLPQGEQGPAEELAYLVIPKIQDHGVVGVGSHAPEAEEHQGL